MLFRSDRERFVSTMTKQEREVRCRDSGRSSVAGSGSLFPVIRPGPVYRGILKHFEEIFCYVLLKEGQDLNFSGEAA